MIPFNATIRRNRCGVANCASKEDAQVKIEIRSNAPDLLRRGGLSRLNAPRRVLNNGVYRRREILARTLILDF